MVVTSWPDLSKSCEDGVEPLAEVPVHQRGEYLGHGAVVKGLDGDDVHVSSEASRDAVSASTRRTHATHEQLQYRKCNLAQNCETCHPS